MLQARLSWLNRILRVAGVISIMALLGIGGSKASASPQEVAIMEDDPLVMSTPQATLQQMRDLGVEFVRLTVRWSAIAPDAMARRPPAGFVAGNPADYPAAAWTPFDRVAFDAAQLGIGLDFHLSPGAPRWAEGPGRAADYSEQDWEPSARMFEGFVHALGERYSGSYDPQTNQLDPGNPNDLPRISFWSIWNEPNYGPSLAPQGLPGHPGVLYAPMLYRNLLRAAWSALAQTGHSSDTILFGETAARGVGFNAGLFNGTEPLPFIRALYCLDQRFRPLTGRLAALEGCPTSLAARRAFRARNPALFQASGFAAHPYSYGSIRDELGPVARYPPNVEPDNQPGFASFADLGNLERTLDRSVGAYGARVRYQIWNTEYGYITSPPKPATDRTRPTTYYASQQTAAYFLNWAEYLSYENPRVASFAQYLLQDATLPNRASDYGAFAIGLIGYYGRQKATYAAWRMPLFMPSTNAGRGRALTVWGDVRPAGYAISDLGAGALAPVEIQFARGNSNAFHTLDSLPLVNPRGYFTTRVAFPASGRVRLAWSYPQDDPLLPTGGEIYSRAQQISIR
jgi:hypothetical protein